MRTFLILVFFASVFAQDCSVVKDKYVESDCCEDPTAAIAPSNTSTKIYVSLELAVKNWDLAQSLQGGIQSLFVSMVYPYGGEIVSLATGDGSCDLCPLTTLQIYSFPSMDLLKQWYDVFLASPPASISALCAAWSFDRVTYGGAIGPREDLLDFFGDRWTSWQSLCPGSRAFHLDDASAFKIMNVTTPFTVLF